MNRSAEPSTYTRTAHAPSTSSCYTSRKYSLPCRMLCSTSYAVHISCLSGRQLQARTAYSTPKGIQDTGNMFTAPPVRLPSVFHKSLIVYPVLHSWLPVKDELLWCNRCRCSHPMYRRQAEALCTYLLPALLCPKVKDAFCSTSWTSEQSTATPSISNAP